MNKPSNWYDMDYTERREWEKSESERQDLEYQARQAQDDTEQARRDAQREVRRMQERASAEAEEAYYMLEDAQATIAAKDAEIARLREALQKIYHWELPDATDANGQPSSYEYEYGSNGVKRHIRKIAREALEQQP